LPSRRSAGAELRPPWKLSSSAVSSQPTVERLRSGGAGAEVEKIFVELKPPGYRLGFTKMFSTVQLLEFRADESPFWKPDVMGTREVVKPSGSTTDRRFQFDEYLSTSAPAPPDRSANSWLRRTTATLLNFQAV